MPHRTHLLIALLVLALLPPSCAKEKKPSGRPQGAGGAVPVLAAEAQRKDLPVVLRSIGTVEAANTVSIRARVGGELTRVAFQEGQAVRQGDVLFTIDSRPFENALASAVADSARDAAKAASAQADVKRYAELLPKEFVTRQEYDAVVANAASLTASVASDAAAIRNARLNLNYCLIRAPIAGRTGKLGVRQGNLITANGDPLVTIQQITPCYVSFSVPEQQLPEIRARFGEKRLTVEAAAPGDSTHPHEGELYFIDNAVDAKTGTILLKAEFPNQDEALWPGQFVDVALYLSVLRNAVVVPVEAVQKGQNGDFVYVVKQDGTAGMVNVTQGVSVGGEVAILSGLEAGQQVVTDGQLRLTPGAKVEIKQGLKSPAAAGGQGGSGAQTGGGVGGAQMGGGTGSGQGGTPAGGSTGSEKGGAQPNSPAGQTR